VRRGSFYSSRGKVKALGWMPSVANPSNNEDLKERGANLGFGAWIDEVDV
jgi:hypothetical protein